YDRADELRKRFSGKVFRDNIKPRWIGDARFWYEVKTGKEASEFLRGRGSRPSIVRGWLQLLRKRLGNR
ncbi:hypothetical protein N9V84_06370, partial [Verrucomicrobiales bacterium]|nr:hypothetical protein [Verrucomicrobiales bacterium]